MPRAGACIGCAHWNHDRENNLHLVGFCSRHVSIGGAVSTDGTWPALEWCGGPFVAEATMKAMSSTPASRTALMFSVWPKQGVPLPTDFPKDLHVVWEPQTEDEVVLEREASHD
jgi:hypothetical protein